MRSTTDQKGNGKKANKLNVSGKTEGNRADDKIDPRKIIRFGKIVYSVFWDSGGPGAGADFEFIYKWRDRYAVGLSFDEPQGPYQSLSEAIRASDLNLVTSATVSISSSELTAEQIAEILKPNEDPPFALRINEEIWRLSQAGKFIKHDTVIEP